MSLSTYIQWIVSCNRCDAKKQFGQTVHRDGVYPRPEYPEGWTRVGNDDFCEKHRIEVHDHRGDAEPTIL